MKNMRILIIAIFILSVFTVINCSVVYGASDNKPTNTTADKSSNKVSSDSSNTYDFSDLLSNYNFNSIDSSVNEFSEYNISFKEIVSDIIGENTSGESNFFKSAINKIFLDTFRGNKTAVFQIIMLAILSAAISTFGPVFNKNQVSDTAQMVISISLITILLASFYVSVKICQDAVGACISIYKSLIPIFFSAVTFASGSATAGIYYEIVLIMITVVSVVFAQILVSLDKIYVLFALADSVTGEERFSKASELIPTIIKWTCRTAIIIFTGLAGIKSMISPISDSMKKNLLYKALQMIPGIGNSIETVSKTVIGAGTIIKNGIGTAAIVVIVMVCSIPIIKLVVLSLLFKVTSAAIEPMTDKRIVKAVDSVSVAIGSLAVIVLVALSMFVLMAAIICISTNYNYTS
jgi:stage III sporulation protein AE